MHFISKLVTHLTSERSTY